MQVCGQTSVRSHPVSDRNGALPGKDLVRVRPGAILRGGGGPQEGRGRTCSVTVISACATGSSPWNGTERLQLLARQPREQSRSKRMRSITWVSRKGIRRQLGSPCTQTRASPTVVHPPLLVRQRILGDVTEKDRKVFLPQFRSQSTHLCVPSIIQLSNLSWRRSVSYR